MSCNQAAATRSSDSASSLATHLARRATDQTCLHRRGKVSASIFPASSAASSTVITVSTVHRQQRRACQALPALPSCSRGDLGTSCVGLLNETSSPPLWRQLVLVPPALRGLVQAP